LPNASKEELQFDYRGYSLTVTRYPRSWGATIAAMSLGVPKPIPEIIQGSTQHETMAKVRAIVDLMLGNVSEREN
jgi:hypothetical protein